MYKVVIEWPDGRIASTGGIREFDEAKALADFMETFGVNSATIEPEEA